MEESEDRIISHHCRWWLVIGLVNHHWQWHWWLQWWIGDCNTNGEWPLVIVGGRLTLWWNGLFTVLSCSSGSLTSSSPLSPGFHTGWFLDALEVLVKFIQLLIDEWQSIYLTILNLCPSGWSPHTLVGRHQTNSLEMWPRHRNEKLVVI